MLDNRDAFIVTFFNRAVIRKLNQLDTNVTYISNRFKYAVVYVDTDKGEKYLRQNLKKIKGFINLSPSIIFNRDFVSSRTVNILDTE